MAQIGNIQITPTKIQQIMEAGRRQLSPEEFEELESLLLDLEIYGMTQWINVRLGTLMSKIEWELEIEPSLEWGEALKACDFAFLGEELKNMCRDAGISPIGHKKLLCARLYRHKIPSVVAVMEPLLTEENKQVIKRLPQTVRGFKVIEPGICPYCVKGYAKGEYIARWDYTRGPKHIRGRGVHIECYQQLALKYPEQPSREGGAGRLPQTEPLYAVKLRQVKDRLEELHRTDPDEFYHRRSLFEQAIKEREKGQVKIMPGLKLEELRELLKFTGRLYR